MKINRIRDDLKPIQRSKLRLCLGKAYYTLSRYTLWYFGKTKFVGKPSSQWLKYIHFSHKTPLLRELKDVDIQYQYNKITNLKLATKRLNGVIIKPGETNRTQPFGSGATCFYPYRDLMIKNETEASFQLNVKVGDIYLEGAWLSEKPQCNQYEIFEKNHCFKSEYWGGFSRHNELYRKILTLEGKLINEEYITENHALMMYSPFLSDGLQ